jgi:hypothetical protein
MFFMLGPKAFMTFLANTYVGAYLPVMVEKGVINVEKASEFTTSITDADAEKSEGGNPSELWN